MNVSATLLYSGEVLVLNAAGQGALYDPAANAWRLAASTQRVSGDFATVMLQTGQVLATGDGAVERYTRWHGGLRGVCPIRASGSS